MSSHAPVEVELPPPAEPGDPGSGVVPLELPSITSAPMFGATP